MVFSVLGACAFQVKVFSGEYEAGTTTWAWFIQRPASIGSAMPHLAGL